MNKTLRSSSQHEWLLSPALVNSAHDGRDFLEISLEWLELKEEFANSIWPFMGISVKPARSCRAWLIYAGLN